MWVKICGNTNLKDAALAAQLGADAVGFVFAEGKRKVTAAQVGAMTPLLPSGVERVGVFDSQDADEIARTVSDAGLTAVQLHGSLDQRLLERLAKHFAGSVRIIQTLHWTVGDQPQQASADALSRQLRQLVALGTVDRVLIDSKVGGVNGGTGVSYDWEAARSLFGSAPAGMGLIVAGGLKPSNIAEAISQLSPWGVDVSSGVESTPGRKNPSLVANFIRIAREADGVRSALASHQTF